MRAKFPEGAQLIGGVDFVESTGSAFSTPVGARPTPPREGLKRPSNLIRMGKDSSLLAGFFQITDALHVVSGFKLVQASRCCRSGL